MLGDIIGAVIVGLIAGTIGKLLMPGKDPGGFLATILIGIAGSLVGWFIFARLLGVGDEDKFDLGGLPGAIIGVVILLFAYRKLVEGRAPKPAGGPSARS